MLQPQSCDAYSLAKALVKIMSVRIIVAYLKRKLGLLGNTLTGLNLVAWKSCSPRTFLRQLAETNSNLYKTIT